MDHVVRQNSCCSQKLHPDTFQLGAGHSLADLEAWVAELQKRIATHDTRLAIQEVYGDEMKTILTRHKSIDCLAEPKDSGHKQARAQTSHGEHLRPENIHVHTFEICSPQHD